MLHYLDKNDRLILELEKEDRDQLQETLDEHGLESREFANAVEEICHETMACNGSFEWSPHITPAVGDMTDGPVIGLLGPDEPGLGYPDKRLPYDGLGCGYLSTATDNLDADSPLNQRAPIVARWVDMSAAIRDWRVDIWRSPVIFDGGFLTDDQAMIADLRKFDCDNRTEQENRTHAKLADGLEKWVEDYKKARHYLNVKLAKQLYAAIEQEIAEHDLDRDLVYGIDPELLRVRS